MPDGQGNQYVEMVGCYAHDRLRRCVGWATGCPGWRSPHAGSWRGADFLTPPKVHASEIRCYLRDPDGHLIEAGQTTGMPSAS